MGRERERRAADVRDLALGSQPLDAERRVVAGHEQHVEVVGGEPHERLDERHDPVAPSISWVSSSTSSSSSSQASWSASATSVAAAWPRCCASASSRGSTAVAIGVARSSGSASASRRSVATTPAAKVPRWRSIASTVYHAALRVRATREARVLFPNPAPATMIVSRRSVPAASRASSSGRSRVPLGSRGGTSLAARLTPIDGGRATAVGAVLRSSAVPSSMALAW